ncbi:hypothetical protein BpHYR1_006329, partial [Brachionus plicatilis]
YFIGLCQNTDHLFFTETRIAVGSSKKGIIKKIPTTDHFVENLMNFYAKDINFSFILDIEIYQKK